MTTATRVCTVTKQKIFFYIFADNYRRGVLPLLMLLLLLSNFFLVGAVVNIVIGTIFCCSKTIVFTLSPF